VGTQAASLRVSAALQGRGKSYDYWNRAVKDVAGRAAGTYRLAACAPPEFAEPQKAFIGHPLRLPNHWPGSPEGVWGRRTIAGQLKRAVAQKLRKFLCRNP
jgi:hypothetical protein